MKRKLISLLAATLAIGAWAAQTEPAYNVVGTDTVSQIFIYSPGEKDGLHLAYLNTEGRWSHLAQLCSSDYSQWGSQKRMYNPSVTKAADGTWRLVFAVGDAAPCFAAAYSDDLITWRPQDYPHMSVKGCLEPVVFAMDDGTFDIYFKAKDGKKHYVQATKDFRHFKEDKVPSTISDDAWLRDTATVNGKLLEGNLFEVPYVHVRYMLEYTQAMKAEEKRNSETMRDDATRFAALPQQVKATLRVDAANEKTISDKLIGVFFEDISYAADGGLYAELIQNRDFEYLKGEGRGEGWGPLYAWKLKNKWIDDRHPLSSNNPHYAVLDYDTLVNYGWDGIALRKGEKYNFSMYTRKASEYKNQKFRVQLVENGKVLAKADFKVNTTDWNRVEATLVPKADAEKAELQIVNLAKGTLIGIDMVSLFPQDTYKGHGLRRDLAEAIAALQPKFVRFPGGCMSHGEGIDNIYHWNHTVGPWQDRKPDFNIWHYHQTRGLGFYEYFQFCEDIGAEPLPVLAAGVPCQNSAPNKEGFGGQQGGIPMEQMNEYIDELCNLIEWANGDPATNKWARMRAEAGHPAPFNLKYLGIGNEDIISTVFEERCEMICKAIKKRYPHIILCGTAGPFHDPSADYIEGWKFAKQHQDVIGMVDEHYYESPGWFINHLDYYDNYDRRGPKVYIGEYASRTRTHESALAEALYLCNVERNADIVEMTSYAPLLAKDGHHNWNPDMIYFNNTQLTLTPSYHTQWLFGNHSGNRYVASSLSATLGEETGCSKRMAASVVKDTATGKTFVKLVNALPRQLVVNVEGMNIPADARLAGFTGKPADKQVTSYQAQPGDTEGFISFDTDAGQPTLTLAPYTVAVLEF